MTRQREPRERAPAFLAFIRTQRCCVCLCNPPVEAAHIRMAASWLGKRATGMQEKPSDRWAVPLCRRDHREGPESQHAMAEADFWRINGIDPFRIAADLWAQFVKVSPRAASRQPRKPSRAKRIASITRPKLRGPKMKSRNAWPPKGSRPLR